MTTGSWWTERAGLDGTVAIVTGGAGGLGEAISLDLAANGVRVALVDRDEAAVERITQKSTLERVAKTARTKDKRVSGVAREKLEKLAAGMQKTIDNKLNPVISNQNITARRSLACLLLT